MKAENIENNDCPQRDSTEHEGYAEVRRSFRSIWKERDSAEPELLEKILGRDNRNRAFKRVKARKFPNQMAEYESLIFRPSKTVCFSRQSRGN